LKRKEIPQPYCCFVEEEEEEEEEEVGEIWVYNGKYHILGFLMVNELIA
jgi:hypothetical protein